MLLTITRPAAPAGATGGTLAVKYRKPYSDGTNDAPAYYAATWDLVNARWVDVNTNQPLVIVGATTGEAAPPALDFVESWTFVTPSKPTDSEVYVRHPVVTSGSVFDYTKPEAPFDLVGPAPTGGVNLDAITQRLDALEAARVTPVPLGLTNTGDVFRLAFTATPGATEYRLYRKRKPNAPRRQLVAVCGATPEVLTDAGVYDGVTAYYELVAVVNGAETVVATHSDVQPARTWTETPLVITSGGTYALNHRNLDATKASVTISTTEPVILTGRIASRGHGVVETIQGVNVTLLNLRGWGLHPMLANSAHGMMLNLNRPVNVVVQNCYAEAWRMSWYVQADEIAGHVQKLHVRQSVSVNVEGRATNANGTYQAIRTVDLNPPIPVGHAIQTNGVVACPDLKIAYNYVLQEPYEGFVEDPINLYITSGTNANRALVHDNGVYGGYAINPASGSYAGTGIILDGKGALPANTGYLKVYNNRVAGTSNAGLAIAGGQHTEWYANVVRGAARLEDGTVIYAQNVGMYMRDLTNTGAAFSNHNAHDNQAGWLEAPGSVNQVGATQDYNNPYDWHAVGTNGNVQTNNTTIPASGLTVADERNLMAAFWLAQRAAGRALGVVFAVTATAVGTPGTAYTDALAQQAAAALVLNGQHDGLEASYESNLSRLNLRVTAANATGSTYPYLERTQTTTASPTVEAFDTNLPSSAWTVSANRNGTGGTFRGYAYLNAQQSDFTLETTIVNVSSQTDVYLRAATGTTFTNSLYFTITGGGVFAVRARGSGTDTTTYHSQSNVPTASVNVKVTLTGTTMTVYLNGNLVLTQANVPRTSGYVQLFTSTEAGATDAFDAVTVTPAGADAGAVTLAGVPSGWTTRTLSGTSGTNTSVNVTAGGEVVRVLDTLGHEAARDTMRAGETWTLRLIPSEVVTSSSGTVTTSPDPVGRFFGRSGANVFGSANVAEPVIVWDADANKYRMFRFNFVAGQSGNAAVTNAHATADHLEGPWTDAGAFMSTYHKFVPLVDLDGAPVKLSGKYHSYSVYYPGQDAGKYIVHATADTLAGPWTVSGTVVPVGHAGTTDNAATDAPFALWDGTTVRLYYMGMPNASHATYGLAARQHLTKATSPAGPFTYHSIVVNPSTSSGAWNYGWIGGVQIARRPDGTYWMLANAGSTRPATVAHEPAPSLGGMYTASSLDGPWTEHASSPVTSVTDVPASDAVTSTNNWRHWLVMDRVAKRWYVFLNTGAAANERITYYRQGMARQQHGGALPANVLVLTTSEQNVPGTLLDLPAGWYRVTAQYNLIADSAAGGSPKLDVDVRLKVNGTTQAFTRAFVGNYAYENDDWTVDEYVFLSVRGQVRLAAQVIAGTPTANTRIRNVRLLVRQEAP